MLVRTNLFFLVPQTMTHRSGIFKQVVKNCRTICFSRTGYVQEPEGPITQFKRLDHTYNSSSPSGPSMPSGPSGPSGPSMPSSPSVPSSQSGQPEKIQSLSDEQLANLDKETIQKILDLVKEKKIKQLNDKTPIDTTIVQSNWTKLSKSYVLPFTMASGTLGFALTFVSNNPVFLFCSIPLGICAGMVRDRNSKTKNNNYLNAGVKVVAIYVLGPTALLAVIGLCTLMALK